MVSVIIIINNYNLFSKGSQSFYSCSSLTQIILSNGLSVIGDYIFYGSTALSSIIIPSTITSIGKYYYYNYSNYYLFSKGYYSFSFCSSLTQIIFTNGLTLIGYGMFGVTTHLDSVIIPSTIVSIGEFYYYY